MYFGRGEGRSSLRYTGYECAVEAGERKHPRIHMCARVHVEHRRDNIMRQK